VTDKPSAPAPLPPPSAPVAGATLWSDDFRAPELDGRWTWLRPRPPKTWRAGAAGLALPVEARDLYVDNNTASVLQAALPEGEVRIELELSLEVAAGGSAQAGLVLMGDDDNYVKLVELARGGLRQVEFAKELAPVPADYPRYGNTLAGTPGRRTWLRLDVQRDVNGPAGQRRYTAYSSQDGRTWVGGAVWTHKLGDARLGLVAMGGEGTAAASAVFTRVTVQRLTRQR